MKGVGGHIVVEGAFLSEGCTVTILVPDEGTFTLSDEDEDVLSRQPDPKGREKEEDV